MDFTLFLYVLFIMGFSQAHRAAFLSAVSGTVGKGLERETLLPFPRLRRFGTHSETGSKFLLLFSIKSKEGILCFAVKVPNGRNTHVVQANFWRDCAHPVRSTAILGVTTPIRCKAPLLFLAHACAINLVAPFLKSPSSSTLSAFSANPPTAPSPAPHPPA